MSERLKEKAPIRAVSLGSTLAPTQKIQSREEGRNCREGSNVTVCRVGMCSAQCLCEGTSLPPSHARFSKREMKPDVGLLPVPVLQ